MLQDKIQRGFNLFLGGKKKGKKKEGELQCCCRCFDGRKKQGVIGFHAHATSL